jgi:small subunit ribosomal protein S16
MQASDIPILFVLKEVLCRALESGLTAGLYGSSGYGIVQLRFFLIRLKGVPVAVVLRLARLGKHKSPAYRIVATDKQNKRDGRFLEVLGTYNPLFDPSKVSLKEDLIKKWLAYGALPSEVVRSLIMKAMPGLVEGREKHQIDKVKDARRKRKERIKARAK